MYSVFLSSYTNNRVCISSYTKTQVFLAFSLVLASYILEERCTIEVKLAERFFLQWLIEFRIKMIFYLTGQKIRYKSCI